MSLFTICRWVVAGRRNARPWVSCLRSPTGCGLNLRQSEANERHQCVFSSYDMEEQVKDFLMGVVLKWGGDS